MQVIYNNLNIFKDAQTVPQRADIYGVSWYCAEEFDAPPKVPISFVSPGAYLALDTVFPRSGGSLKMEVKTQRENAVLMYNTGPPSR